MGYLGSYISDFLIKKKYVCEGIDVGFFKKCNLYKEKKFKVKFKSASKIDEKDIKDFDVVIQLAAFSNDPFGKLDPKKFYKPTTKYTLKIAKICKKLNKKFIFPSSCSVYGYGKSIFSENSKVSPLTDYSKNKIEIEKGLKKLKSRKFNPIILRLATVYGISPRIRLDVVINMLTSMVVSTKKIKLNSNGLAWRPHLNIKDVANAIRMGEAKVAGAKYLGAGTEARGDAAGQASMMGGISSGISGIVGGLGSMGGGGIGDITSDTGSFTTGNPANVVSNPMADIQRALGPGVKFGMY